MLREQYAGRPRIRLSSTLREENDFIVRANPYLLGIALQNVVDNACKYSDKDVEISLFEKEGRKVVEIRDQGIGIPQEEVELNRPVVRKERRGVSSLLLRYRNILPGYKR